MIMMPVLVLVQLIACVTNNTEMTTQLIKQSSIDTTYYQDLDNDTLEIQIVPFKINSQPVGYVFRCI
jgi:hypothetical protein